MSDQTVTQRRPQRPRPLRLLPVAMLLLLTAACGSPDDGAAAGADAAAGSGGRVDTVNVGAVPATSAVLLWTAQEQGFFADHDLEVVLQPANGGAATVPALQSGAIHVGQGAILNALQAQAAGLDIPCFLGNARLSPRGAFLPLVASAKSGAKTAQDLVGKTIAVNALAGVQQLVATAYLESEGVDPDKVEFVAVEIPAMTAALASGQVDAAIMTAPFSNLALSQGATMLTEHPEIAIDEDLSFACYIATRTWLEENPDVVDRFKQALAEALDYLEANPDYEVEVIAKNLKTEPAMLDNGLPLISPELSTDDVQQWVDLGTEYGVLDDAVDPGAVVFQ